MQHGKRDLIVSYVIVAANG